jgi:hypothetical protein
MSKNIESQLGIYVCKLIYATLKDLQNIHSDANEHDDLMFQTYDNLCKKRDDRLTGVKNRFTLSDPVKQFIAFFFKSMIEEIKNIELQDAVTVNIITDRIIIENAICYMPFMVALHATYAERFGATLKGANDTSMYIHNRVVGHFPQYASKLVTMAAISTTFDAFLKAIAWIFGSILWYSGTTITEQLFLGVLSIQSNITQDMLDTLRSCLRDKPAPKSRSKHAPKSDLKGPTADNDRPVTNVSNAASADDDLTNLLDEC